jgi:pimeloyl-ACP methyl ester carboxylesterase
VVDAPGDQWGSFSQRFRETPRYGADIEALLSEVGRKFGIEDWTYVGTSDGSISAFHAGRMNPALAKRVILTASVMLAGRNGPGLSGVNYADLKSKLLWVNHEDDPCAYTLYRLAKEAAEQSGAPLLKVTGGGPSRGDACQAFTAHGFVGVEKETVLAMRSWVKTGVVPADVKP